MTLERHRSKLIPDIDFAGDGRLFVTDREGTFPLRHKDSKKAKPQATDIDWKTDPVGNDEDGMQEKGSGSRGDSWEYDPDYRIFDDLSSYRSFDPKRDKDRKYKPKPVSNYEKAMRDITGTISSTGSSSLTRKVHRSKSHRSSGDMERRYGSMRSAHSAGSGGGRFKRGQRPEMPPEMRDSLRRENRRYRSLDVNELRKANRRGEANNNFDSYRKSKKSDSNGHVPAYMNQGILGPDAEKDNETLPKVVFIIVGILLILCGIVRLLLSQWHEYFHSLWTGGLLLLLGILAACHRADYVNKCKNLWFIIVAAACSVVTMVAMALIMQVLVPLTRELAIWHSHISSYCINS